MVRFENVGLRYGLGPEVLRDLTFRIDPHSFQFLTGPSGAGKTSLLRLLFLSMRPTRGLITQFGHDVATLSRDAVATLRRRIGIVFQDFRLLDHMTTYENVALPLRVMGRPEDSYRDEVIELLNWVGLGERMWALPPVLSGGEKQRAAIARAVIARPQLLLADEPTGNVDPSLAQRLLRSVRRTQQVWDVGRDCHPRHRANGPIRRAPTRSARRPSPYLRLRKRMTDYMPSKLNLAMREPEELLPHFETPLVPRNSISGRALIAVVAIMTFLASLTTGAAILVSRAAGEWQSEISREVTIQVIPAPGRDVDGLVDKAVSVSRAFPGIVEVGLIRKTNPPSCLNRGSAPGSRSMSCRFHV